MGISLARDYGQSNYWGGKDQTTDNTGHLEAEETEKKLSPIESFIICFLRVGRRYCQNKINSQLLSKFTISVTTDCYFPCFRCHPYLSPSADKPLLNGWSDECIMVWSGSFWATRHDTDDRCQSASVIDHFSAIKVIMRNCIIPRQTLSMSMSRLVATVTDSDQKE